VATVNFLVLYALMHRQLRRLESRRMLAMLGKVAIAGAALFAVCAASSHWLLADWATQAFWSKLSALLGTVVAGALVFGACGAALHIEEIDSLREALRRRLSRGRQET
jgi:peptidoglycan biosynthesis protein MviN/MurJ (putative lipid II flippase)